MDLQTAGVGERLAALVLQMMGPASNLPVPLPMDAKLSDLGVSSLKLVNLMLALEVEFDVTIPQADITPDNFHSLNSVAALLSRIMSAR